MPATCELIVNPKKQTNPPYVASKTRQIILKELQEETNCRVCGTPFISRVSYDAPINATNNVVDEWQTFTLGVCEECPRKHLPAG